MTIANAMRRSEAVGRALMISTDAETIRQVCESMQAVAISTEVCAEAAGAISLLNHRKFEAVVVDIGRDAKSLIERIRQSPASRTVVIFAVIDDAFDASATLKCGASFVMWRPLSQAHVEKLLRVAYGSILRERRRYFRCLVRIPVVIQDSDRAAMDSTMVNIGTGGFGMDPSGPLKVGVKVRAQFNLPGNPTLFAVEATTCWCEEHYVGLQFAALSPELESELEEWLSRKLEEGFPEEVTDKFRSAGDVQI